MNRIDTLVMEKNDNFISICDLFFFFKKDCNFFLVKIIIKIINSGSFVDDIFFFFFFWIILFFLFSLAKPFHFFWILSENYSNDDFFKFIKKIEFFPLGITDFNTEKIFLKDFFHLSLLLNKITLLFCFFIKKFLFIE